MIAEQIKQEGEIVNRKSRNVEYLLKKYKTKQKGECNLKGKDHPMVLYRQKKRIRFAQEMMKTDTLNLPNDLKTQVIYLMKEGPSPKQLCARCKWETVVVALILYVKFTYTKKRPVEQYVQAREVNLTEQIYGAITTKLGKFFQEHMALNKRIRPYEDWY